MRPHSSFSATLLRVACFLLTVNPLTNCWAKQENWIEVTSPHFTVVTNGNEKQGRRVADQFERMRAVFHVAFPSIKLDPASPIIVLAIKDEKDFRALEPQAYLAKGSLKLGGLFLRGADKNYVLMRLDAEGDHPYAVVYHEYTHLLMSKSADWVPLWMNEGLAEFYQNTDIRNKDVALGQPSPENILLLRQNRLLPLETLFTIDEKSPYYHEEDKGSIFYAESWALMHYIQVNDFKDKTTRLADYATLLSQRVDPITAGTRAFGDLKQLYKSLNAYVEQGSFGYFKMPALTEVDESAFKLESLTPTQADAVQADFLAYNGRDADAQALLNQVLQSDPNNVSAHETMGFMAFRQRRLDEAKKLYAQAVQLDSKSFLAHYYYAAIAMNDTAAGSEDTQIENSLRTSIKLNPSFAPSYDRLEVFLLMRHRNLDEAHTMGLVAVTLDPANVGYRINVANALLATGQGGNAVNVLHEAAKLAKSPAEIHAVEVTLANAQRYAEYQELSKSGAPGIGGDTQDGEVEVTTVVGEPKPAATKSFVPSGPHHSLVGVLKNVRCADASMELTVASDGKTVRLRTDNYYKIEFTALNVKLDGDLNPCKDLENRPAKVEYVEPADKSDVAHVLAVEIHK